MPTDEGRSVISGFRGISDVRKERKSGVSYRLILASSSSNSGDTPRTLLP
jgi:hypothetical protein